MNLTYRKNENFKRKMEVLDQIIKERDETIPVSSSNTVEGMDTIQLSRLGSNPNNYGRFLIGIDRWGTSTSKVGT